MKGLREGTVDPDKIKIEGIETEEEKKKKEVFIHYIQPSIP